MRLLSPCTFCNGQDEIDFFRGLGIRKWICHFLFTCTRVLIILQHAWTKWKVTKTEIKFPSNRHIVSAEARRKELGWLRVSKCLFFYFLIRHGWMFCGLVFDLPFRKCWLMIRAQLEFEFCLQTQELNIIPATFQHFSPISSPGPGYSAACSAKTMFTLN